MKIITPKNNGDFESGAQVYYQISVSDIEDGESKYKEINPIEVILEVRHVSESDKAADVIKQEAHPDPAGFASIRTAYCFNCHAFSEKKWHLLFLKLANDMILLLQLLIHWQNISF